MNCPECNIELYCPCNFCQKARKDKTVVLWKWINGEFIKCPNCGYVAHADKWENIEYQQLLKINSRTGQAVKQI